MQYNIEDRQESETHVAKVSWKTLILIRTTGRLVHNSLGSEFFREFPMESQVLLMPIGLFPMIGGVFLHELLNSASEFRGLEK